MQLEKSKQHAKRLVQFLEEKLESCQLPIFMALDGRSGCGKSTVAALVADYFNQDRERPTVTIIEGDQFYGGGSDQTWELRTAAEKVALVIDWRRQRPLLEALSKDGVGYWQQFDWSSDNWDSDDVPLAPELIECQVSDIVILEGAYSGRPELADLLDFRVLVTLPPNERRARIQQREGDDYEADWTARWWEAEDLYFGKIVPEDRFDLVLVG